MKAKRVPTKIFLLLSNEDRPPANKAHPQPYRKEVHCQSRSFKQKYSQEFTKLGFNEYSYKRSATSSTVVCSDVLSSKNQKCRKLEDHLKARHLIFIDKPITFFRRLEKKLLSEKKIKQE